MPAFEMYWPEAKRNAALADIKSYLIQFGDDLHVAPSYGGFHGFTSPDTISLQFPLLTHPATKAEVSAGRAIFSLDNPNARLAPLAKPLPLGARWVAHLPTGITLMPPYKGRNGAVGSDTPYIQGVVYQAEEVQDHGQWKRFYGFIGPDIMARVPAEDLVFVDRFGKQ